jgi:hypothetical protein
MAQDTDKDGIPDSIDPNPTVPDKNAPVIQAPAVGANPYARSTAFPAKGTNVFRPGVTYVDPKTGKKTDVTGKFYTALYSGTNEEAIAIKNTDFLTTADQNQIKSLMVQGGFLNKSDFQTAYWGQKDTEAFRELLAEANSAGGMSYQEMLKMIASGDAGRGQQGPTKNISYNISDPIAARGIVQNGLRAILGRDPSEKESKMLVKALNAAERENPSVTTQTMVSPGVYSSTTTGGLNAAGTQQLIEETVMANPALEAEAVDKRLNSYGDVIGKLAGEF